MDKKIAGLLGAVAGIATIVSAQAATPSAAPAALSYADLLAPIPDAVEQLKAADAARAQPQNEQVAQYYNGYYGYGYTGYNSGYGFRRHHHHHHHHHH